jgi:hypothetical protein
VFADADEARDVVFGSPTGALKVDNDAFTSKAGGVPVWINGHSHEHERPVCTNCKTPLFLVAQVRLTNLLRVVVLTLATRRCIPLSMVPGP